jgi:hypothetical protein
MLANENRLDLICSLMRIESVKNTMIAKKPINDFIKIFGIKWLKIVNMTAISTAI